MQTIIETAIAEFVGKFAQHTEFGTVEVVKAFKNGKVQIQTEEGRKHNVETATLTVRTEKEENNMNEIKCLPKGLKSAPWVMPTAQLEGTIADGGSHTIAGVIMPGCRGMKRELVRLERGNAPVSGEGYNVKVLHVQRGVTGKVDWLRIKVSGQERKITRRDAVEAFGEDVAKNDMVSFSDPGCLLPGNAVMLEIPAGDYTEVKPYVLTMDRARSLAAAGQDTAAKAAISDAKGLVANDYDHDLANVIAKPRVGYQISGVVIDSDVCPDDQVVMGRKALRTLAQFINREAQRRGSDVRISVADLTNIHVPVVRHPAFLDTSVQQLRIRCAATEHNLSVVSPFMLKECLEGDADGDILLKLLSEAVVDMLLDEQDAGNAISRMIQAAHGDLDVFPAIKRFGTPVGKKGEEANVLNWSVNPDLDVKDTDVLQSLATKGLSGQVVNPCVRLRQLACAVCRTAQSRKHLAATAGKEITEKQANDEKAFRRLVNSWVRKVEGVMVESTMDSWKPEYRHLRQSIMAFISLSNGAGQYGSDLDALVDANLLDKGDLLAIGAIKRLTSQSLSKALSRYPEASVPVKCNFRDIAPRIAEFGVDAVLGAIDGLVALPSIGQATDGGPRHDDESVVVADARPEVVLGKADFADYGAALAMHVNALLPAKGDVAALDVTRTSEGLAVRAYGWDLGVIPNLTFDVKPSVVMVKQFTTARVSQLKAVPVNINASTLIEEGRPYKEACGGWVYHTILHTLIEAVLEACVRVGQAQGKAKSDYARVREAGALLGTMQRIVETNTEVLMPEHFEVSTHAWRVQVEEVKVPVSHLLDFHVWRAEEIRVMANPLTGGILCINPAFSSKNDQNTFGIQPEKFCGSAITTHPIDLCAHLSAGKDGVNKIRHAKEAWTTRMGRRLRRPNRVMGNVADRCQDPSKTVAALKERFADAVVLVADLDGVLSFNGECSDSARVTRKGARTLETYREGKAVLLRDKGQLDQYAEGITGLTGDAAIDMLEQMGYTTTSSYQLVGSDDDGSLYSKSYKVVEPVSLEDPTWLKVYFEGYKGIAPIIDQDFYVMVDGVKVYADIVIDSRTFFSKKLQAAAVLGMLSLRGVTDFSDKPVFGVGSYHDDLCLSLMEEGSVDGTTAVYGDSDVVGRAYAARFRTCVLKQDPEGCEVKYGFSHGPDFRALAGEELPQLVSRAAKARLAEAAAFVSAE